MWTSEPPKTRSAGNASAPPPAVVADALGKIFVAATLYSQNRARVTALGTTTADLLRSRASGDAPCTFKITEDGVEVDGDPVVVKAPGLVRLRQQLDDLGVSQVDFFRTVTSNDLIEFARVVRTAMQRKIGNVAFVHAELKGLPPTIAARHNDFGTPIFGNSEAGTAVAGLAAVPGPARGLDEAAPARLVEDDWQSLARLLVREMLVRPTLDAARAAPSPDGPVVVAAPASGLGGEKAGSLEPGSIADAIADAAEAAPGTAWVAGGGSVPGDDAAVSGPPNGTASGAAAGTAGDGDGAGGDSAGRGAARVGADAVSFMATVSAQPGTPSSPTAAGGNGRGAGMATEGGRTARGRRERLRAVEEAVRRAIEHEMRSGARSSHRADRILEEARRTLPLLAPGLPVDMVLEGIRVALDEHLRDAFRSEGGPWFDPARAKARETIPCELEVGDLLNRIAVFTSGAPPVDPVQAAGSTELLAILLTMLQDERRPAVTDGITRRLSARLSRPPNAEVLETLASWTRAICLDGDTTTADRWLPLVFETLRRAAPGGPATVLVASLRPPTRALVRVLWPYLALETLLGLAGCPAEIEKEALELLAGVDRTAMSAEAKRLGHLLETLPVAFSPRLVNPPREELFGLYEILLDLGLRGPARLVVDGFRAKPPALCAAAALVVLDPSTETARTFLARVLRERASGGETESLHKTAAAMLLDALEALTPPERKNAWVATAVRALGCCHVQSAAELVERVRRSRRFFVLWAWPAACREAAREARSQMNLAALGVIPTARRGR